MNLKSSKLEYSFACTSCFSFLDKTAVTNNSNKGRRTEYNTSLLVMSMYEIIEQFFTQSSAKGYIIMNHAIRLMRTHQIMNFSELTQLMIVYQYIFLC